MIIHSSPPSNPDNMSLPDFRHQLSTSIFLCYSCLNLLPFFYNCTEVELKKLMQSFLKKRSTSFFFNFFWYKDCLCEITFFVLLWILTLGDWKFKPNFFIQTQICLSFLRFFFSICHLRRDKKSACKYLSKCELKVLLDKT